MENRGVQKDDKNRGITPRGERRVQRIGRLNNNNGPGRKRKLEENLIKVRQRKRKEAKRMIEEVKEEEKRQISELRESLDKEESWPNTRPDQRQKEANKFFKREIQELIGIGYGLVFEGFGRLLE